MNNLKLAMYWYYRLTDNYSKEHFKLKKRFGRQKIELEIYLINNGENLKKTITVEGKVILRLQVAKYFGNELKQFLPYLKGSEYKQIWDKKPDDLSYNKWFKQKAKFLSREEIHKIVKKRKTDYLYSNKNSEWAEKYLEKENCEIIYMIPSDEGFARAYESHYNNREIESAKEILDDYERVLRMMEPSISIEFDKFLLSIGIEIEGIDFFKEISNQKEVIHHKKNSVDTDDGNQDKYGYYYKDWINLTKQHRVEILADFARKDIKKTSNHWWCEFKAEFPDGYSVELARYKTKFKKTNKHEKFKKNGLMFYKSKE